MLESPKIAIIGLGYVGLTLAWSLASKLAVISFDINETRIKELQSGKDNALEGEAAVYHLMKRVMIFTILRP